MMHKCLPGVPVISPRQLLCGAIMQVKSRLRRLVWYMLSVERIDILRTNSCAELLPRRESWPSQTSARVAFLSLPCHNLRRSMRNFVTTSTMHAKSFRRSHLVSEFAVELRLCVWESTLPCSATLVLPWRRKAPSPRLTLANMC